MTAVQAGTADRGPLDAEDARLIADFLRGDAGAVAQVSTWLSRASRPYRARLASWEDAQQELLLEVASLFQRGSFRGESRLKTYLWRVANHTCLNLLRAQGSRARFTDLEAHVERLEDTRASALDELLIAETARGATRLAQAMPAECRRLWALILHGLSYRDMSAALNVPEGALRVRVHRCRKQAQAQWRAWKNGKSDQRT